MPKAFSAFVNKSNTVNADMAWPNASLVADEAVPQSISEANSVAGLTVPADWSVNDKVHDPSVFKN